MCSPYQGTFVCFLDSVMTLEWPHYSKCFSVFCFFFKSCPVVVNFIPRLKALFLSCFTVFCFHWWLAHCWLNHSCFAAVKRLLKCVIRFVQTPRLPSLNKCAATDLDYLHFFSRINLFALQYSRLRHTCRKRSSPFWPTNSCCCWHAVLNYNVLINVCNKLNLYIAGSIIQSIRYHRKILILVTPLYFSEEWLCLSSPCLKCNQI